MKHPKNKHDRQRIAVNKGKRRIKTLKSYEPQEDWSRYEKTLRNTGKPCSCSLGCGNLRQYEGNTMQEKIANGQDYKTGILQEIQDAKEYDDPDDDFIDSYADCVKYRLEKVKCCYNCKYLKGLLDESIYCNYGIISLELHEKVDQYFKEAGLTLQDAKMRMYYEDEDEIDYYWYRKCMNDRKVKVDTVCKYYEEKNTNGT